jgi:hypothetical protein
VETRREHRHRLEQEHELAERERVELRHRQVSDRRPRLLQRQLGGALLHVEQRPEALAAQIADALEVAVGAGDLDLTPVVLDAHEDRRRDRPGRRARAAAASAGR